MLIKLHSIGLHAAANDNTAQFYIGCVQIEITGQGTASPKGLQLPGFYEVDDPGLKIDIYNTDLSTYQLRELKWLR